MAHLVLVRCPPGGSLSPVFPLVASRTYLGRDPQVPPCGGAVVLLPHHAVARRHAMICRTKDGFAIEDLNSRGRTFINSRHDGQPRLLIDGDRIKICDFLFVFRAGAPAPPAEGA